MDPRLRALTAVTGRGSGLILTALRIFGAAQTHMKMLVMSPPWPYLTQPIAVAAGGVAHSDLGTGKYENARYSWVLRGCLEDIVMGRGPVLVDKSAIFAPH